MRFLFISPWEKHSLWANPAGFINKTTKGLMSQEFFTGPLARALQRQSVERLLSQSPVAVLVRCSSQTLSWVHRPDLVLHWPNHTLPRSEVVCIQMASHSKWAHIRMGLLGEFQAEKKYFPCHHWPPAPPVFSVDMGSLCYFRDRSGYKPHQSICLVVMWKEKEILYNPYSWSAETLKYEIWL